MQNVGTFQPERLYTQIVGVVLLIWGILGLLIGEVVNLVNFELVEDLLHIILGVVGVYLGFFNPELRLDRMFAQVSGALLLLLGILGMVDPTLFGLFALGLTPLDHAIHLVVGVIGLAIGFYYNTERIAAPGRLGRRI
ncbi:MAG: DUF4383 domain-containing protein [Chloroflexi bacterium]|nr:DUF4383 domain-containing protein [Chloroflexota bacterium]